MKQRVFIVLIIYQGIILSLMNGVKSDPEVNLEKTKILGKEVTFENQKVNQYLGIPYAEPPTGDLRFKKTVPLETYPDQIKAYDPPPACPQYSETPFPWYFNDTVKSEDCLYMNIWTPSDASPQNLKPVLVWIYSGCFKYGSNSLDQYSGEILSALGGVTVVTFNYRLGALGFFSSNTVEAPGNAGLWDMREALLWINKHINSFGGDPSKITLSGHGLSSTAVGYFTLKEENQKLFSQLIMQSGSPVTFTADYKKSNEVLGLKLAKKLGCATDDQAVLDLNVIQCLKNVSADDLASTESKLTPKSVESFHPITGDSFLPDNPRKSIMNGNFSCKPLLTGNSRDEGSIILPFLDMDSFGFYGENAYQVTTDEVIGILNKVFRAFPELAALPSIPDDLFPAVTPAVNPVPTNPPGLAPAVTAAVPVDALPNDTEHFGFQLAKRMLEGVSSNATGMRYQVANSLGDVVVLCPTEFFAEQCAAQGVDVYYYFFVHRSSDSPYAPWMGVTHYSDVPYVFGGPLRKPDGYTKEEQDLSRQMIVLWTNFVKTGKPDSSWPKYSQDNPKYKVIGGANGTQAYGKGPHKTNCDLMRSAYKDI